MVMLARDLQGMDLGGSNVLRLLNTSFPKEIRMKITINPETACFMSTTTLHNNDHVRVSMQCTAS
jgi:hypothetical protein